MDIFIKHVLIYKLIGESQKKNIYGETLIC